MEGGVVGVREGVGLGVAVTGVEGVSVTVTVEVAGAVLVTVGEAVVVADGVGVGDSNAAPTAKAASSRPQPYNGSQPGSPRSTTAARIRWATCTLFQSGQSDHESAATPVTWGAAIDVPDLRR